MQQAGAGAFALAIWGCLCIQPNVSDSAAICALAMPRMASLVAVPLMWQRRRVGIWVLVTWCETSMRESSFLMSHLHILSRGLVF